jgi:hypothetical protein
MSGTERTVRLSLKKVRQGNGYDELQLTEREYVIDFQRGFRCPMQWLRRRPLARATEEVMNCAQHDPSWLMVAALVVITLIVVAGSVYAAELLGDRKWG